MEETKIMSLVNEYIKDNQVPKELVYFVSKAFTDGYIAASQVPVLEYKTAYEWFDTYPCRIIKDRMYKNTRDLNLDCKYKNLSAAIFSAIRWSKTLEGNDFWANLYWCICKNELPKYNELKHFDKSKKTT
jgi:hypothetical protein